jgi:hypothetical protein
MSQRISGYARKSDENYETIAWPIFALLSHLPHLSTVRRVWDPCNRGSGRLVATLRSQGIGAIGTGKDFFTVTKPPTNVSDMITNPPYGEHRRGELAVRFIEHALELKIPRISMLLRNDFDSAISRQHLFRACSMFAGKLVLLNRIKWFDGPSSPSDNHSWFLWEHEYTGAPLIHYVTRHEAEAYAGHKLKLRVRDHMNDLQSLLDQREY